MVGFCRTVRWTCLTARLAAPSLSREVGLPHHSRWFLVLDYLSPPRCYGPVYDALGLHESGC
ncbi:hypothetical protein GCM10009787_43060 [Streptomyces bangladeshensis]|uniref:Secreted protein n=1 Tax=Streptomyces bangladeshensis TaxID=295352 RepID=A0ABN3BQ62_9ACTN